MGQGKCTDFGGDRRRLDSSKEGCGDFEGGPESNPLSQTISLDRWISCLPRWILKSKTEFAFRLTALFADLRRSHETSTTVFPLPLIVSMVAAPDCRAGGGGHLAEPGF